MISEDKLDTEIHNLHIHAFTNRAVPKGFFGGLSRFFYKYAKLKGFIRFLYKISRFGTMGLSERFANYAALGSRSTQEILDHVFEFYPENTKYGVLAMDMAFMKAGKVTQPYYEQLEDLSIEAGKDRPQTILPFICVDPRRKDKVDLQIDKLGNFKNSLLEFVKYWIEERNFAGIKLYPPLGYFPWDTILLPIYEYAAENNIPIIAHCSPGVINSKESKKKLRTRILNHRELLIKQGILNPNENLRNASRKELCSYFTHPKNYEILIEELNSRGKTIKKPNICLGHFGGADEVDKYLNPRPIPGGTAKESWFYYIRKILEKYDNMYADISFTWGLEKYDPLLKITLLDKSVREKILFGSDFYMNQVNYSERNFGLRVRANIGERNFKIIAEENPKRFLSNK